MNNTGASKVRPQSGFSLVELMIAVAIGLILLAALTSMFVRSTDSYNEVQNSAQQIENGRYAMDLITQDLHHAAFYGDFTDFESWWPVASGAAVPASLPDPCLFTAAALTTTPYNHLAFPVQAYDAPNLATRANIASQTTCAGISTSVPNPITAANLAPGTDILVVRRADTSTVALPVLNDVYIQASNSQIAVQFGNPAGFTIGALTAANGILTVGTSAGGPSPGSPVESPATLLKKANIPGASPVVQSPRVAADIRKYHVHIYFIAPCSRPANGGLDCTGSADDGGNPVPTLKRLELTSVGGTTVMSLVPLVEGIENMQVEFGIDNSPVIADPNTGLFGDGAADQYKAASDGTFTLTDWANVVSVRLNLLARNVSSTQGYTDTKQYALGALGPSITPNDHFKRHLYSAEVRLTNASSRRENP